MSCFSIRVRLISWFDPCKLIDFFYSFTWVVVVECSLHSPSVHTVEDKVMTWGHLLQDLSQVIITVREGEQNRNWSVTLDCWNVGSDRFHISLQKSAEQACSRVITAWLQKLLRAQQPPRASLLKLEGINQGIVFLDTFIQQTAAQTATVNIPD